MSELEEREKSSNLGQLKALLPFIRPYTGIILLALLFLVLGAVATLSLPIAVRQMIDLGFAESQASTINRYFLMMFLVAVAMAVFTGLRFYTVSKLGQHVVADLRDAVYQKVLSMSPAFFERTRTGEVLSRINTDTTLVETVVGSTFSISLRSVFMLIGSIIMMVISSPKLAGMIGLAIPFVVIPIAIAGRQVRILSKQSQDRIADCSAMATETLNAVDTVQSYAQTEREQQRFSSAVRSAFKANVKRIGAETLMAMSTIIIIFGAIVAVLWAGAKSVIAGDLSAGTLSQFVIYAILAATTTGALTQVLGELQRAAGALERILELLQMKRDIQEPQQPVQFSHPIRGDLVISDLSFAYPSRPDEPVLQNVDLHIRPGETVALVGPSGAGKSTLFQLLLRFYDPQQGSIQFDGLDITQLSLNALRRQFAWVSQDVTLFSSNALENIRYGRPDSSEQQVQNAAEAAHAHGFIEKLPEQYSTYLGERGVRLSGGQAQRLSIARALLTDSPVLLLDEATSALDAESERLVQGALESMLGQRTSLVIAHRLATIRKADRIVMLDQGRISAEGTHAELKESNPLYRHLAELQFLS